MRHIHHFQRTVGMMGGSKKRKKLFSLHHRQKIISTAHMNLSMKLKHWNMNRWLKMEYCLKNKNLLNKKNKIRLLLKRNLKIIKFSKILNHKENLKLYHNNSHHQLIHFIKTNRLIANLLLNLKISLHHKIQTLINFHLNNLMGNLLHHLNLFKCLHLGQINFNLLQMGFLHNFHLINNNLYQDHMDLHYNSKILKWWINNNLMDHLHFLIIKINNFYHLDLNSFNHHQTLTQTNCKC